MNFLAFFILKIDFKIPLKVKIFSKNEERNVLKHEILLDYLISRSINESNSLKKKSWDDWLLSKAIIDLKKIELKKERRNRLLIEKKKLFDEKRQKAELAKEVREEWIKQKTFLTEKKKREAAAQEEFERLKVMYANITSEYLSVYRMP